MDNQDDKKGPCAPDFFICTTPEMDALERAAADGKHSLHYQNLEQEAARIHQVQGSSHFVRLEASSIEEGEGLSLSSLETLTGAQDADAAFVFLYISRLLAPPAPLPGRAYAGGKISFDDVIEKIGWTPRSTVERREMHKRIYDFIRFGERAQVIGTRRGKYRDKQTGEEISTTIHSALWRIMKEERPQSPELLAAAPKVPVEIEVVMSHEWTQLLTQPQTAQYLPMAELLGAIPGAKPSGAWARVIGLALASFWRRLPRESQDGSIKPTRRELLERYTPKTGSVQELLASTNPQFAITYWCGALRILVESEFLKDVGEATVSPEEMRAALPRKGWSEEWLNAKVDLQPGPKLVEAMKQRIEALPPRPTKRKGGRPRKKRD